MSQSFTTYPVRKRKGWIGIGPQLWSITKHINPVLSDNFVLKLIFGIYNRWLEVMSSKIIKFGFKMCPLYNK